MKTFTDYVTQKDLTEIAAYDVGTSVLGRTSLDANSEKALTAAFQAFEIVLAKAPQAAIQFLNRQAQVQPELKAVLQQHGLDSFGDAKTDLRKAATKGRRIISKGLADVGPDDVKHGNDVIATNSADAFHNPLG